MQKERDFHRMNHKRVVQEKNRLISDMKRYKIILVTLHVELNIMF